MKETDRLLSNGEATTIIDEDAGGEGKSKMYGRMMKTAGIASLFLLALAGKRNYYDDKDIGGGFVSSMLSKEDQGLVDSSNAISSSSSFKILSQLGVQPISKVKSGGLIGGRQQEPRMILKSEFASMDDDERYSKEYIPYSMITPELGNWGQSTNTEEYKRDIKASFDPESLGLPRHFDARKEWAECKGLIGTVRDQGKCGSCWAVAATEVMNDRVCIAHGKTEELSPQYALSCYSAGAGCEGGNVIDTLQEAIEKGVPTGGMFGDSSSACLPYEFEACDHPCQVPGTIAEECPTTCADGTPISETEMMRPTSEPYECPPGDWKCITQELHKYGSMAVTFGPVCDDFYGHKHGVYEQPEGGKPLGLHATKIIGWGFEGDDEETGKGGKPYWIMINSWQNWGEHGVGRIGIGEMSIESEATSIKM